MPLEDFLVQQATITAEAPPGQQPAQDASGAADRSDPNWVNVASGVPCLVCEEESTLDYERNDARANVITGTVYFLTDPAPGGINTRHRITITQALDPAIRGAVYAVKGRINPNTMGHHFEVSVERIRTP